MDTSSLVEQVHSSPELWGLFKWTVTILTAGYGVLWWIVVKNIVKRIDKQSKNTKDVCKRVELLEKAIISDYVSYKVFDKVVKDFKYEIHVSMRDLKDELHNISNFLMGNTRK